MADEATIADPALNERSGAHRTLPSAKPKCRLVGQRRDNRCPRLGLKGDSVCCQTKKDNSHWHSPDVNRATVFIFKVSDAVVQIFVNVTF
jgi:hypothetical protein